MEKEKWRSVNAHKKEVEEAISDKKTLIVFDTETTGLETDAHIIQFSGIKYNIGENYSLMPVDTINLYINPEQILDQIIVDLTGITQETVDAAPTEREVVRQVMNFLNSGEVWAGQNVSFDLKKVEHMCKRCNQPYEPKPAIDSLKMARNLISIEEIEPTAKKLGFTRGNHKLATITTYLFPDYEAKYHDSLEDVRATALCLSEFLKRYKDLAPEKEHLKQVVPNYAFFWQNPYKGTDQRLRVAIPDGTPKGNSKAIYYDCLKHFWTSYSDAESRKLFETIDMTFIEKSLLYKYRAECIEDLVRNMRDYKKDQIIAKKNENKPAEVQMTIEESKSVENEPKEAEINNEEESEIDIW